MRNYESRPFSLPASSFLLLSLLRSVYGVKWLTGWRSDFRNDYDRLADACERISRLRKHASTPSTSRLIFGVKCTRMPFEEYYGCDYGVLNQVLRDGRNRIKITFCSLRSIISNNSLRCLLSQVRGLSEDRDSIRVRFVFVVYFVTRIANGGEIRVPNRKCKLAAFPENVNIPS